MTRGTLYPLIDRVLDGGLEDRLRVARSDGKSYFTIAAEFTSEGFQVSTETVRQWCEDLAIGKHEAGSAA